MAWQIYDNFRLKMMNGNAVVFTAGGDTLKIMTVTSAYTVNLATHDFIDDVSASEVTGTGYTAGGATLGSKTLNLAAGVVTFDAADTSYTKNAAGFSNGRRLALYKDTGTPSTSPVIAYHTETVDFGNVAGDLTYQWDALGLITSP